MENFLRNFFVLFVRGNRIRVLILLKFIFFFSFLKLFFDWIIFLLIILKFCLSILIKFVVFFLKVLGFVSLLILKMRLIFIELFRFLRESILNKVVVGMKFVFDISIFVNFEVRKNFGDNFIEVMKIFLSYVEKFFGKVEFYMLLGIYREVMYFVDSEELRFVIELYIIKKFLNVYELKILVFVVYEFIEDIWWRIDKGFRVVEKVVRESVLDIDNVDNII